ncbi:hypothetical protein V1273_006648 [Bradyrhizobium sp. AZCC 1721]
MCDAPAFRITASFFPALTSGALAIALGESYEPVRISTLSWVSSSCTATRALAPARSLASRLISLIVYGLTLSGLSLR